MSAAVEVRVAAGGDELAQAFKIRHEVFCGEQKVPEALERDALDASATHVVALDAGRVVGTARFVPYEPGRSAKVGRVAIAAPQRKTGAGKALMKGVEDEVARQGFGEIVLDAQIDVRDFYLRLGYAVEGKEFVEAGIVHQRMRRRLSAR